MDENEQALNAVIDDMGKAARQFKAKRYEPKPVAQAEPEAESDAEPEAGAPTADELAALLGS